MRTLLITVDALRRDHLGCYGYERNTTPFLDKLAEENTVFRNCYSASCHTREAIPSILTGRKPENCLSGYYRLDAPTVPENLPEKVETTGVTTGCYLTRTENHNRGFDNFTSDYRHGSNMVTRQLEYFARIALNRQYRPAEKLKEQVVSGLESEESFVWAHLMDVHAPYNKYEENYFGEEISRRKIQYLFRKAKHTPSLMTEEDRKKLVDAYDNSLRNLDSRIEKIMDEIPEDTEVFIVGDHGELLGEEEMYTHPRKLVDELLEVPLIVKNGKNKEVEKPVTTVDIAPTITDKYNRREDIGSQNLYSGDIRAVESSCLKSGNRVSRRVSSGVNSTPQ